jgi:hypothetical protein
MDNIGKVIRDGYCGGFFGREFDLWGAVIVGEGESWIVIKKENGIFEFGSFQDWDWNRDEDGSLSGGIYNLRNYTDREKQEMIDEWCGC